MKTSELIKKIKGLKGIEPDQYFSGNLRRLILATPKNYSSNLSKGFIFKNFKTAFALSLAAIIVFIVIAGINFKNAYIPYITSLDKNGINEELSKSDINIYLNEVGYWQENEKQLSSALNQISNNKANSVNTKILEKESQAIDQVNQDNLKNPKIDELLNSLL